MQYFQAFIIGFTLSLDAFSLTLALSMNKLTRTNKLTLISFVTVFHFILPLLGSIIGNTFINVINIQIKYLLILVLIFITISIINSFKENKEIKIYNNFSFILLSLMVALDSFSVGIGIKYITSHIIVTSIIFSLCSFFFTTLALIIGKLISLKAGTYSKILEIIILFTLIIYYLCK
ncbi:MAG: manganese efflux pump [Bacilli bacterium]